MSVTIGAQGATEQAVKYRYTLQQGWQTVRRWVGPKDSILAIANQLADDGYEVDCDEGPQWSVTGVLSKAADGSVEIPINNWELTSTRADKDLLSADIAIVNGLSYADKKKIRENYLSPPETDPTFADNTNALKVYKWMIDGFTAYPVYVPVLRHTFNVSASYNATTISVANVRSIFTTDKMRTSEGAPTSLLVDLPSFTTTKAGFAYGWFKEFPNLSPAAYNKRQASTDYVYGLYPTDAFTFVT